MATGFNRAELVRRGVVGGGALIVSAAGLSVLPAVASADEAYARAAASPTRRVIVLDDDHNLLGLLCLNQSRTGFCQTPGS